MNDQNDNPNQEGQDSASLESESSEDHSGKPGGQGSSPVPHEEQKRYWKQDLFYKKLSLVSSSVGLLFILLALAANYRQIAINTEQLRLNTEQSRITARYTRASLQNSVTEHVITLDRVFMDKPYLRPYFYESKPIAETDEKYQEVAAAAEMVLDIFDMVADQNKGFPDFWDRPEAWDEWIIDIFSTSPILRDTLDKRENWYDEILIELYKKGKERLEQKSARGD